MEQNNKPENPKVYARPHSEYIDFNINNSEEQKVIRPAQEGITLRDHYAGLAMQALVNAANTDGELRRVLKEECYNADISKETYIAYNSYRMADAMLTERQKEK